MSSPGASEESKDKALEVLAIYLTDDELVDFSTFNMHGTRTDEDREKFMLLTNMHQHALYQLGLAIMEAEVEGEGAMEVFVDMLAMTGEALRQLRPPQEDEAQAQGEVQAMAQEAPEVGGGSPGTDLGLVEAAE